MPKMLKFEAFMAVNAGFFIDWYLYDDLSSWFFISNITYTLVHRGHYLWFFLSRVTTTTKYEVTKLLGKLAFFLLISHSERILSEKY